MLAVLVKAGRCAVRGYMQSYNYNMTPGKDHRTHDLALVIFNEEVERES